MIMRLYIRFVNVFRFQNYIEFKETIEAATRPMSWFKRVLKTLITYLPYVKNTCEHQLEQMANRRNQQ